VGLRGHGGSQNREGKKHRHPPHSHLFFDLSLPYCVKRTVAGSFRLRILLVVERSVPPHYFPQIGRVLAFSNFIGMRMLGAYLNFHRRAQGLIRYDVTHA